MGKAANGLGGGEARAVQVEQQGDRELRSGAEPLGEVTASRHDNGQNNGGDEHGQ